MDELKLQVPVSFGLESIVKKELYKMGFDKTPADNGRINITGTWDDVARLNVCLRSGERVLIVVSEFEAKTFDELYEGFYSIPWENYLEKNSQILMDGKSYLSTLAVVKACGGVAKKAIIRRLADKIALGRTVFSESGARSIVGFSIYKDKVTVTLDTTGDSLHKRGYRSLAYTAPLKETLAAALIQLSFYNPNYASEKPFADVFCGSGTLPIEAALYALNIAPGINRNFDFENWAIAPKNVCKLAKERAKDEEKRDRKVDIYGSDISSDAISIAKYHAKKAGVDGYIKFETKDMRKFCSDKRNGIIISNPPYGERLLSENDVKSLYRDFGNTFRALPDWSCYVLTSFENFERFFGKSANRKKKLYNANLTCSLYSYFGKKQEEYDE